MQSLNHIYRTIWSEVLGTWIAVSEITRARGKRSGACLLRALNIGGNSEETDDIHTHRFKPLVIALACCFAFNAQANPNGGVVVHGTAGFNASGNTLTVTNTPGTIINWQGFSINAGEVTRFVQQSASSTVLNRVVTNNPSVILGALQSNGQVYLVNANGIMFGAGSTVDVAGLVATSLNLSDADFLAGRHNFTAVDGAQNISNAGNINAQQGGQIYLIAPNVENNGIITAPNGEILLAAGHSVEIVNSNDPDLRVSITAPAGEATNVGQLIAASGNLGLFGAVVKNSGLASADSAVMQGGKIVFKSSQRTEVSGTVSASGAGGGEIHILSGMQDGTVQLSGTLDASAPASGNGGFVDTSAAHVRIEDGARISTLAPNGVSGNWLIDPTDYYISAVDPANGSSWMSNTTLATNLGLGNVTIQTLATGAGNGDIFVNDAVGWNSTFSLSLNAHRNININAAISNTGAGSLLVRADATGIGTGTIIFGGGGSVALTAGAADFYYNPSVFGTPNNYVPNVTGTLRAWMLVNNDTNLQNISTNLAGNYALGRDIDAATVPNFVPLGNITTNFTGRFDGLGHTISNLTITNPGVDAGLFGVIGSTGTVSNVGLVNSIVVASNSTVGGLAGLNAGTISNSYVSNGSVTVTGPYADVGGLVGSNSGTIIDSHVEGGSVHGEYSAVGGLAGSNVGGGTISQSYVNGGSVTNAATWAASVGGMVGNNAGTIVNSYVNGGSVTSLAAGPVGGLVGRMSGGSIASSYASNASLTSGGYVGGLIGEIFGASTISNSFWDTDTSGILVAAGFNTGGSLTNVLGLTTVSTMTSGTVAGYLDTVNIWWLSDTNTRPFLRSEWSNVITNAHELQLIELNATAGYKQANNIDMAPALAAGGMWSSAGFKSIGDFVNSPFNFAGSYDGGGFTISNLTINRPTASYVGLFGMTNGASISNVALQNANLTGLDYVGGLVGYSSTGTIIDGSHVDNSTIFGQNNVGGLMGYGNSSTVSNSYAASDTVTGTSWVGGLAGSSYNTNISDVYANSNVTGNTGVGGLLGQMDFIGSLNNGYVSGGSVVGVTDTGGLVGSILVASVIANSHYNINAVTINGANAVTFGGLYNDSIANGNGVGQFTDWLNGGMALNIANYTTANGGSLGTAGANSYTIGTAQGMKDLLGFADNAAYTFTLSNNITMPAGTYVPYLAADFNGGTFTISGLNLNLSYASRLGLFGQVAAGTTVSNVYLSNASVLGGNELGALAGLNEGTVVGSHSTGGAVSGVSSVGGLVGHSLQGSINTSYVSGGTVDGVSHVGGLVGLNDGTATNLGAISAGFITGSYVDGGIVVNGTGDFVGGLAGQSRSAQIDGSHATLSGASVTGGGLYVGGLVGMNGGSMDTRTSIITNSWVDVTTSGTVSGTNYVGGLVGFDSGEGVLTNNSVTGVSVSGDDYVGGLAGMMNFAGFSTAGNASGNSVVNSNVTGGVGIGGANVGGLAGYNGKDVLNNYVSGGSVNGASMVGGLIGQNTGIVSGNFVMDNNVSGSGAASDVGGLVGNNSGGIDNTYVSGGTVNGYSNVGGLVGGNSGSIVFSYVSGGSVTGMFNVGGVLGLASTGVVGDNYWDSALATGNLTNGIGYDSGTFLPSDIGAAALTATEMMTMASFVGWDIASSAGTGSIWYIIEGQSTPQLNGVGNTLVDAPPITQPILDALVGDVAGIGEEEERKNWDVDEYEDGENVDTQGSSLPVCR